MMFMACSLETFSVVPGRSSQACADCVKLVCDAGHPRLPLLPRKEKTWMARTSPAMTQQISLHPRHIELRLLAGAVAADRAVFADCVGALQDPVLPRRQA